LPQWTTVALVAALYLAVCLAVGLLPGRRSSRTAAGYVAGDRTMGLLLMYFITGATIFSAFAFLGAPGWAFSRGAATFYILGYGTLGFIPFYFLGPRAARLGRSFGFVTQAEMVAHRFGLRPIAALMALASLLAFIPYLALQMQGAGYVVYEVTGGRVPRAAGAAIVYAVVLTYVLRSGVLGVGWTNTFQGIFMMALAWGLGLYLPWQLYGGVGPMFEQLAAERSELLLAPGLTKGGEPWSWAGYSSTLVVMAIGFSFWPHLFMKAYTARDEATIRRTVVLYPTFQVFLIPLLLIGFAGVLMPGEGPARADQILPHMLMNMDLPAILVGLFCAGALAASMSSGDAIAHAAASILVRDGWKTGLGRHLEAERERNCVRAVLVVVMVVAYAVALGYRESLVDLLIYAYGPVTLFAPTVVATLYWRGATGAGALGGLVGGMALLLTFQIAPWLRPWPVHAGLYALVANILILVVVSRLTRRELGEEERRFLEVAGKRGSSGPAR